MTRSELVEALAKKTEMTKSRADSVVGCIFDMMAEAIGRGEKIELRGFGSFTVRQYKPYKGRNPRSGKAVSVAEKRLPVFKAGTSLKALLNRGPRKERECGRVQE